MNHVYFNILNVFCFCHFLHF